MSPSNTQRAIGTKKKTNIFVFVSYRLNKVPASYLENFSLGIRCSVRLWLLSSLSTIASCKLLDRT